LPTETKWTGPVTGTVNRAYDADLRVTQRTVNGANPIASVYDVDGLLTQVGELAVDRDVQNGFITGTTLGTVSDVIGRNTFGEPTAYAASANGSGILALSYTQDAVGRIVGVAETIAGAVHQIEYSHDDLGRLVEVARDGVTTATYGYDAVGNRLTGPGSDTYTYDAQERLVAHGTTTYAYAGDGGLASKNAAGQVTSYQHDALGRLRTVASGGTTIAYVIDGVGRRIGKRVNGTLVQGFLYQDGLRPIAELDGNNAVVSRFVYATRANVPDYLVKQGVAYRILADQLGSPRLVVRATDGVVVQRIDYDEFGRVLNDTQPGFQPFGFAGGLYDTATGLVHFGAREYDPAVGRFISKDPNGLAGGLNPYVYAGNDPVDLIDTTGREAALALTLAFSGSAAGSGATGGVLAIAGAVPEVILGAAIVAGTIYATFVAGPELIDNLQAVVEENADATHDDEGSEEGGAPPDTAPDGGVCGDDGGKPQTLPAPRNPDAPTLPAPQNPRAPTLPVPSNPDAPTEPAPPRTGTLPSGPGPNIYDQPFPKPPKLPTF
jgi:RHS repeat-associated protein